MYQPKRKPRPLCLREGTIYSNHSTPHQRTLIILSPTYAQCPSSSLVSNSHTPPLQTPPQTTNIIDPDNDKLYCFCGRFNFGEMIGCGEPDCETEWFHFCVCRDPSEGGNLRAAGFARVIGWERIRVSGRRLVVVAQGRWESNRGGGRVGKKSARGGARRDGRVKQRSWYRISFKYF